VNQTVIFFLILSFLFNALSIFAIILLYLRQNRFARAEQNVNKMVKEIEDIFSGQGLTDSNHTRNNAETLSFISELIDQDFTGLVFANCIDFDMLYGHRNDCEGFYRALKNVDDWLGENLVRLRRGDLLIITADHGGDPTTPSTDHSREYTPLLIAGPGLAEGIALGTRKTFADIAASLCDWFRLEPWPVGEAIRLSAISALSNG